MKLHRKILGGVAALGLVGGLTVFGPSPASAQSGSMTLSCFGSDQPSTILIDAAFPQGVPIPVTVNADVPASLAAGASAPVSFTWVLDAGTALTDMAGGVGITHLTAALTVGVQASNSSGGPFAFPSSAQVGINPPNQPTLTASGQVTAGSSGEIAYSLTVSTIDITAHNATGTMDINMNCTADTPHIATTTITADGPAPDGGGGTPPSDGGVTTTSAPKTPNGNSQPRVTG